MNGRIYDPELGRFLSADPILQFPASTQGLDRYAYVLNNPVSLSDPSGHLVFGIAAALIGAKLAIGGQFALAALSAAIGGYLDAGSLKAAIFSAISAGFSFGVGAIGSLLPTAWHGAVQLAVVATLHGLTQGILAVAQGGKFGAGFLSAAASSVFGPKGSGAGLSDGKRLLRILQSAAVGGTASRIGGGKFANGAVTGAFVQAFNEMSHDAANGKRPKVTFEEGTEALAAVFSKHEALLNKTILDKLPGSVQEVVFELGETRTGGPMEADPRAGRFRGRVVVDRAYATSLASQDSRITAFQMGHEFF